VKLQRTLLVWAPVAPVAFAGGMFVASLAPAAAQEPVDGRSLYLQQCASCHSADGSGVEDRGPPLLTEGRASTDFVLRTGRMPLSDPDHQPDRKPVRLTEEQIVALVDYVGEIGNGPDIPPVDAERGSTAAGGRLFRLNCAACHVASGAGASIGEGGIAPSLMESTPTQVAQAMIVGPGAMPVFGSMTEQDQNDIAAYVRQLQDEDATGWQSLGGVGPVAEGLAAWTLGLLAVVALARWIGTPASDVADDQGADDQPVEARDTG
jgi:ubiquinol-cytochrome c reductase cytochrome c subunit